MHVLEQAAAFALELRPRRLPEALVHDAERALIDWHAAWLAGATLAPATLLERALAEEIGGSAGDGVGGSAGAGAGASGGAGAGARLADGRRATVRAAALINGTAAHTAEVDDIFREGIYHPGAPTIAAAWALAQSRGASGLALLRALIVGYEISTRIGAAMGRSHYERFHNTGTIGCFGAAAAAADLLELDAPRFAHALATVATFAAGLQQALRGGSMSKPLHAGRAAEAGVLAALSAAAGVTGTPDVIEGEAGFARALGGPADWKLAMATLGQVFHVSQMTFKNHCCCGHTFAAIDGALSLRQRMGVSAHQIESLQVGTYRAALEVAGNEAPATAAEAKFSLRYVVATALVHGNVRLAAFEPPRLADPATRALMRRIVVRVDPELDAGFPAQRAARLTLRTHDGRERTWLQPTRKGDPDDPLGDGELEDKFVELVTPALGADAARTLLARLWRIHTMPRLDPLVPEAATRT
jgi:2-methylcitrate dehydratase PrpD